MNIIDLPYYMAKCLLLTIIIEIIIGIIIGVRNKKDIINIILVNIITNPIVVTVPVFVYLYYGYIYEKIILYLLEIITVLVEGIIYFKVLKFKKTNPFLLSLLLNLSSYLIGIILNII